MNTLMLQTKAASQAIESLLADGWNCTRHDFSVTLTASVSGSPRSLAEQALSLKDFLTDAQLVGSWGTLDLTLVFDGEGLAVESQPDADLEAAFGPSELSVARAAFGGDVECALALDAQWTADIGADLGRTLRAADSGRRWQFSSTQEHLAGVLRSRPWWGLGSLLQSDEHVVFLVAEDSSLIVESETFSVVGWNVDLTAIPSGPAVQTIKQPECRHIPTGSPSPRSLWLTRRASSASHSLLDAITRHSAALAWASLSTSVTVDEHNSQAALEFFGYQRVSWTMGASGPRSSLPRCHEAVSLSRWASDEEPDKLLAVRQVVSLYRSSNLWDFASDIRQAAEPVFIALRSEATAEAFKAVREARSAALNVARQTSESATALAKGTIERTLAVFAAIFGIVVARASQLISLEVSDGLRLISSIYLVVLAVSSLVVEGPLVTSAISSLKKDLKKYSEFVSETEVTSILSLDALSRARRHAWTVRGIVPLAYGVAAVAVLRIAR